MTQWQSTLLNGSAPYTVLNCRKVCRQAFTEAVKFRLIPSNPFDLVKAPRAKRVKAGRALSPADAKALIAASQELRLGAAVTLLFCQGWHVSEVLGLAWEDLDLDAGTAQIRRGASYTSSIGMVLGSTKTSGAEGVHLRARLGCPPPQASRRAANRTRAPPAPSGRSTRTTAKWCRWCSRPSTVGWRTDRPSPRRFAEGPRWLPGSILTDWPVTAADERWSLRSTPTADSTSPMLLGTSAAPTRRRPPSTSAASATVRRTQRRTPHDFYGSDRLSHQTTANTPGRSAATARAKCHRPALGQPSPSLMPRTASEHSQRCRLQLQCCRQQPDLCECSLWRSPYMRCPGPDAAHAERAEQSRTACQPDTRGTAWRLGRQRM